MKFQAFFLALGMALAIVMSPASASAQVDPIYTGLFSDTAVGGYDPVAYFTEGQPVKGSKDYQTDYKGAEFRFSSQENLDLFLAEPTKYAPQYGGYCAWAVANNKTAKGNPQNWAIVDGKLYLNINHKYQKIWNDSQAEFIESGDTHWPGLVGETSVPSTAPAAQGS